MDVSNPDRSGDKIEGPKGSQLIDTLVSLTGLQQPAMQAMQAELGHAIHEVGHSPEGLTLDQLREAMLAYLETFKDAYTEEDGQELSAEPAAPPQEKLKLV